MPKPKKPTALQRQVGGNHYKQDVIQHVEFCQRNKLTWCESAALKYMMRHRKKNGRQDIEKAIHYLELLLQLEYPEADECVVVKPGAKVIVVKQRRSSAPR